MYYFPLKQIHHAGRTDIPACVTVGYSRYILPVFRMLFLGNMTMRQSESCCVPVFQTRSHDIVSGVTLSLLTGSPFYSDIDSALGLLLLPPEQENITMPPLHPSRFLCREAKQNSSATLPPWDRLCKLVFCLCLSACQQTPATKTTLTPEV